MQGAAEQQADVLVKVTERLEDLESDVRDTQVLLGQLQGTWILACIKGILLRGTPFRMSLLFNPVEGCSSLQYHQVLLPWNGKAGAVVS